MGRWMVGDKLNEEDTMKDMARVDKLEDMKVVDDTRVGDILLE